MGYEEDRDAFANLTGGAFSGMEQQMGPEMHQTLVEHNKAQLKLIPLNFAEFQKRNAAECEALEAVARRHTAMGFLFLAIGLSALLVALASVLWVIFG